MVTEITPPTSDVGFDRALSSVATNTSKTIGSSSTLVLGANAGRNGFCLINDSNENIYISLSDTAVLNSGIRLNATGGSITDDIYTGVVSAICTSGSKNLTIVEY